MHKSNVPTKTTKRSIPNRGLLTVSSLVLLLGLLLTLLPPSSPPATAQSGPTPPITASDPALTQFVNPNPQPVHVGYTGMNTYFTGLERLWNDTVRDASGNITADGTETLMLLGRQVGITWAREELSWANLERNGRKKREWGVFDNRLRQIAASGYGIIGMVSTTPAWARPSDCNERVNRFAAQGTRTETYWCPPAQAYIADFALTLSHMVERYDGDGAYDAPGSPRVAVWQIWNEPNAWETWPGTPAEYGELLVAAYAAVKQSDPTALVAIGGVYVFDGTWNDGRGHQDGLNFYNQVFAAVPTAWHSFDIMSIHPYMPDVAPDQSGLISLVSMWGRVQQTLTWLHNRSVDTNTPMRPIWITEVGWSTCSTLLAQAPDDSYLARYNLPTPLETDESPEPADASAQRGLASNLCRTEAQQANYMVRTHAIALMLGVQHVNYFQLEDKFDGAQAQWGGHSILDTFARGYRPKVAYGTYAVLNAILNGAQVLGPSPLHGYGYNPLAKVPHGTRFGVRVLAADGAIIDIVWVNTGVQEVGLRLEPGMTPEVRTRDWLPANFSLSGDVLRVRLSEDPLYIRQVPPPAPFLSPTPEPTATLEPTPEPTPTAPPTATPSPTATPIPLLPPAVGNNGQVVIAPNQTGILRDRSPNTTFELRIPAFAVYSTTTLSYTERTTPTLPLLPELSYAGHAFRLNALHNTLVLNSLEFVAPLTLVLKVDERYLQSADGDRALRLYRRTPQGWRQASVGLHYSLDPSRRELTMSVQQTGEYVLVVAPRSAAQVYLPLVRREAR